MGQLLHSRLKCIAGCDSSDAGHVYENDKGEQWFKCFSCGGNKKVKEGEEYERKPERVRTLKKAQDYIDSESADLKFRSLNRATADRYMVRETEKSILFPYFNSAKELTAIKFRKKAIKDFFFDGDTKEVGLFGQEAFPKGGKFITITEGEFDAMAAYQLMGSKYPVVSVKTGAEGAVRDCKASYEWLDSFDNIVICFDNDAPGQKAALAVAELFSHKAKVVRLNLKDANEYAKLNKAAEFVADWWRAEEYTPEGIIAGSAMWDSVAEETREADCYYPFDGLNEKTCGIRKGELVVITSGSGLGKTSTVKEIVFKIHKTTEAKTGLMFLEELPKRTAKSLVGMELNVPIHLPGNEVDKEELQKAFQTMLGTDKFFFFDHFGSTDIDTIMSTIRYFVKSRDCEYVFLDHISIIVSAQAQGDERKAIDEIMTKLATLVRELNIGLFIISHLKRPEGKGHEDGAATSLSQLRGSGGIAQLADIVIGVERNNQDPDPIKRNTTFFRVLKNRYSGDTGPAGAAFYDKKTGRMYGCIVDGDEEL
jgi:twinkle protein